MEEIARIFRVPLHMIGDLEHATFSNVEYLSIDFVKYSLDPWLVRWEQAISRSLLSPDEKKKYFAKFNVDGLLRGDYQSRMNGYATGIQNGFYSINDVRELENMDKISAEDGGDFHMVNGNMVKIRDVGAAYQKHVAESNDTDKDEDNETDEREEEESDEEVLEMDKPNTKQSENPNRQWTGRIAD